MTQGFPSEYSSCLGKERFDTAQLAFQVAARRRKQGKRTNVSYRCAHCRGWHIGNTASKHTLERQRLRLAREQAISEVEADRNGRP